MGWDPRQLAYLGAMGIDVWVRREPLLTPAADPGPQAPQERRGAPAPGQDPVAALDWEALRRRALACTLCGLHGTRTQVVFGVGDEQADWLFVGEAPGADEDRQGEPFVGRAGQLLNAMLQALGLSRERVYIANILKCRPPRNRDPRPEEAQACRPYLQRQIELLSPRVIVALGRIAAQNLLQTDTPIGRLRGRRHVYGQTAIPVVVTYHPAYLLRSPLEKRKAWQDLCLARGLAGA
jgi:DNA polymerase